MCCAEKNVSFRCKNIDNSDIPVAAHCIAVRTGSLQTKCLNPLHEDQSGTGICWSPQLWLSSCLASLNTVATASAL